MTDVGRIPARPNASVRKAMPKPFQRPSIVIGSSKVERRQWVMTPVHYLKEGDILPGVGRIFSVEEIVNIPDAGQRKGLDDIAASLVWLVRVRGGVDNIKEFHGADVVWAFTAGAPHES